MVFQAGFKRQLFIGTAGTTATTAVDRGVVDLDVDKPATRAETTHRGPGTSIPRESQMVTKISCQISFGLLYDDSDANIGTILAAAETKLPISMVVKRMDSGQVEFDGDVTLEQTSPGPLEGTQEVSVTAVPTNELREWSDQTPGP